MASIAKSGVPAAARVPESVVELLQLMVQHDTVNAGCGGRPCAEAALVETLERLAEGWDLRTRRLPVPGQADNLLFELERDPALPWLLFDSHLDTVAVEGMTGDPFGAELRDGMLYGRGACDTKASGAAMLWALREYAADPSAGAHNIALLLSVDEEVAMTGIRRFVDHDLPALGWDFAGAIVGEPTELHPVVAHNGLVRWRLTTHGKAAHSSVPHQGVSAISAMARVIERIESRYIPSLTAEHALTGMAACSINLIRGGTASNIIPDRCEVEIDRRLAPGEAADRVLPEVAAALEGLTVEGQAVRFEQRLLVEHPPLTDGLSGPLAERARAAVKGLGLPGMLVGAPFATHASYFCQAGYPAVVLGPGDSSCAHQAVEWVEVSQVERGAALYLELMRSA